MLTDQDVSSSSGDFEAKIKSLQSQLEKAPASYDVHIELIATLHESGDVVALQKARENMHTVYPLSPKLWLEWIADERTRVSTDEDKRNVEALFKRAIDDYDDPSIWLEYCLFAIANLHPDLPDSVAQTEAIFELALSHHGLNVVAAGDLWDAYRDFMTILYHRSNITAGSNAEEQRKKLDKLFRRQLRLPLKNMELTLDAYTGFLNEFDSDGSPRKTQQNVCVPKEVLEQYKEAFGQLKLLLPFEEKIEEASSKDESKLLSAWLSYLDWIVLEPRNESNVNPKQKTKRVTKNFSPNHICCLFERAVTALCLHPVVWLRFVNYLESALSSEKQRSLHVLARSVRNCPWSVDLWLRYALTSEMWVNDQLLEDSSNGFSDDSVKEPAAFSKVEVVFETALSAGLQVQSDLIRLWLGYCDHLLRRVLRAQRHSNEWDIVVDRLRSIFVRAEDDLQQHFDQHADPDGLLAQYRAFVEAKHLGDLGCARSTWAHTMQQLGRGTDARFWLAYLQFERCWGDAKHFYRISRMAINSISADEVDSTFPSVLRLAAETGLPIMHYTELESRIRQRLADVEYRQMTSSAIQPPDVLADSVPASSTKAQRKRPHAVPEAEIPTSKKAKPNVSADSVPAPQQQIGPQKPSVTSKHHGEFVVHNSSLDHLTVFVSNLDFSVSDDQLRACFETCGVVSSVRLVRDYAGRSKGYAYVLFEQLDSVERALRMDRQPISGSSEKASDEGHFTRPMFVSRCDPSQTRQTGLRYTVGHPEPEKLFVRDLDKLVTQEELEKLFGQYENFVSVRLVTYRNGAPKGHAYVQFADADSASRALVATDGLLVGKKNISVAISNPPLRDTASQKTTKTANKTDAFKRPVSTSDNQPIRTHARSQLSFLPRAVNLHTASKSDTTSSSVVQTELPTKSNADFRKMFISGD